MKALSVPVYDRGSDVWVIPWGKACFEEFLSSKCLCSVNILDCSLDLKRSREK